MKNNVYRCKSQFYYIKVGFKGDKIIWACFRDGRYVFLTLRVVSKCILLFVTVLDYFNQ